MGLLIEYRKASAVATIVNRSVGLEMAVYNNSRVKIFDA
jgi:hypothetical protein